MEKLAIISGISGMDGTYLAKYLLDLGYKVIGIVRRNSTSNEERLSLIKSENLELVYGDVTDATSIDRIVCDFEPDEFYHLAANSFVGCSWKSPIHAMETNTFGTINCLEAVRKFVPECRFYFAGSSEQYGDFIRRQKGGVILNEDAPMVAASPYGVSKVSGYQLTKVYRESYDMFAACGILFNHCSELRGQEFFTRKVTSQLAKIKLGLQDKIVLGNLKAKRDEGYAGDYVKAMHLILQHKKPDDFVISSGETHSCQEWLQLSLNYFGLDDSVVQIDQDLYRPNEVTTLIGDSSKAREILGWRPTISYQELNRKMCEYDLLKQSSDNLKADNLVFNPKE